MNLPNKLTLTRIILFPVVVIFIMLRNVPFHWLIAAVVFIAASITDFLDGRIARKRGIVTDFGKLMDPIADKLLVISAFVALVAVDMPDAAFGRLCSPWVVIIILAREFTVQSARMIYVERGTVIAANIWGKMKTVIQIISLVVIFAIMFALETVLPMLGMDAQSYLTPASIVITAVTWLSAIVTVISGITYLWNCRDLFKDAK